MADGFKQGWVRRWHSAKGVAGTNFRNGAFDAIHEPIMAHLEKKRPVAKTVAALNAFGAANTEALIYLVLKIGVLHIGPFDGRRGAQTIFRSGIQVVWLGIEKTGAKLAIAANGVSVNTFHRRLLEHAVGGAVAAS